jgi:hypothetical protein
MDQIFIHESTLNSMISVASTTMFPMIIDDANCTGPLMEIFANALKTTYGDDVTIKAKASLITKDLTPVKVYKDKGITLGYNNNFGVDLTILASNANVTDDSAIEFSVMADGVMNMTMAKLIFWPNVDSLKLAKFNIKQSKIVLDGSVDYLASLQSKGVDTMVANFNKQFVSGWSLAALDPRLAMITGWFFNTTMSPYIQDEYIYAGFSLPSDKPSGAFNLDFTI